MEKKTYYTDRRIEKLAAYLIKKRQPFYCDGRIIEFEATEGFIKNMACDNEDLALIPFVIR